MEYEGGDEGRWAPTLLVENSGILGMSKRVLDGMRGAGAPLFEDPGAQGFAEEILGYTNMTRRSYV